MIPYGHQSISGEDVEAVVEALRTDWLTTGPAVLAFERALAARTGADFAVSVTSGTAALHTAYAAAGIGPGDEIITSPLTFVATASVAVLLGATVRFADVQPDTGNLDPDRAAAMIGPRTKALVAVDYAGHPADLDELRAVADQRGLLLIEDAAHSLGSTYRGRPVGSIADLTTFSFFPTKNITTAEGGAVCTTHSRLAERMTRFRNHGLVRNAADQQSPDEGPWHQEVHEFGLNYRLPDVLAALGTSQLRRLGEFKSRRAEIVSSYDEAFRPVDALSVPGRRGDSDPMWHLYPLRVPASSRRRIFESLRDSGIGVQVNYVPVYWHPAFNGPDSARGSCPVAERYYKEEISLPLWPGLPDADVDRVITATLEAVSDHGAPGSIR